MDDLPDHLLLPVITKLLTPASRIFSDSGPLLFAIEGFSAALRSLDFYHGALFYLFDHKPCAEKISFMQQLSDSEYSTFCIALASQLFQQPNPDIWRRLNRSCAQRHIIDQMGPSTF